MPEKIEITYTPTAAYYTIEHKGINQKFVDDFGSEEFSPLVPVFLKGAHIVYAHSVLQRAGGLGYILVPHGVTE